MPIKIIFKKGIYDKYPFEIVERKGLGHPDTLCDFIAEEISREYSQYCLKKIGFILPHMIDKIGLIGGLSNCNFGHGKVVKPITLLLNGRLSTCFNNLKIPAEKIALETIKKSLKIRLPLLNQSKNLKIQNNLHCSRGPGVVKDFAKRNERSRYYRPKLFYDVMHNQKMIRSNDTSTAVGYYPLSVAEKMALKTEHYLNSNSFKTRHPYVGSDIKVMVVREKNNIGITCCIPFIAKYTPSLDFYIKKKEYLKKLLQDFVSRNFKRHKIAIFINTRDNYAKPDVYLTAIGSAIETGDEGLVGRGNRYNGIISFNRPMSLEAYFGKNPVHHIGKVYTYLANKIAKRIYNSLQIESEVYLVSQMGRPINDPWGAFIILNADYSKMAIKQAQKIFTDEFKNTKKATQEIISQSKYAGC